ncbi:MAG: hypothetical protein WC894_03405 [Patescibacteria group bacterium]
MPKKTKKQKLLASYHRKIRSLENKQMISSPVPIKIPITTSTPATSHETKSVVTEPVNQYFFSDLKKSLILIVLIVGVEVGLYFAKLIK